MAASRAASTSLGLGVSSCNVGTTLLAEPGNGDEGPGLVRKGCEDASGVGGAPKKRPNIGDDDGLPDIRSHAGTTVKLRCCCLTADERPDG